MAKTMKKKSNAVDNSTYVKLEFEDAMTIKRQSLECQKNLLRIMKIISTYNMLRKKELMHKIKLKNITKNLRVEIINFKKSMPHPREEEQDFIDERKTEVKLKEYEDIDEQLNEINERLKAIG